MTVIRSDCKKRARLNALRFILSRFPYANRDTTAIGQADPLIVGAPSATESTNYPPFLH